MEINLTQIEARQLADALGLQVGPGRKHKHICSTIEQ
jgi:hypothetical protein